VASLVAFPVVGLVVVLSRWVPLAWVRSSYDRARMHLVGEWSATRADEGLRDRVEARPAVGQLVAAGREDRWVVS
jgi:hypothetical protein